MTGGLRLRPRLDNSIAELELKFSFADKYKSQSDLTKAIFGQPDSKVPGLFDTATTSILSKQEDGSYGARLNGPISKIKPRPLLAGGRRSTAGSSSAPSRRRTPRASARRADDGADEAEPEAAEEAEAEAAP